VQEIDDLLMLLENPTRRRILWRLAVEPHYPLQLSKELKLSVQAVMKHLDLLEKHGVVRCTRTESRIGPARKCYVAARSISLRLDMTPNLFEARIGEPLPEREGKEKRRSPDTGGNPEDLLRLRESLSEINRQISMVDRQMLDLIRDKEEHLWRANQIMQSLFNDYVEREVLHYILAHEDFSLSDVSRSLGLREESVRNVLRRLREMNLLPKEEPVK